LSRTQLYCNIIVDHFWNSNDSSELLWKRRHPQLCSSCSCGSWSPWTDYWPPIQTWSRIRGDSTIISSCLITCPLSVWWPRCYRNTCWRPSYSRAIRYGSWGPSWSSWPSRICFPGIGRHFRRSSRQRFRPIWQRWRCGPSGLSRCLWCSVAIRWVIPILPCRWAP